MLDKRPLLDICLGLWFFAMQMWAIKGGREGLLERFSEFVPEMALSYPFELDGFQKEVQLPGH